MPSPIPGHTAQNKNAATKQPKNVAIGTKRTPEKNPNAGGI
mgnify:CR=1 FL=1